MRFSCNRSRLSDILSILSDVVPLRSPKPVLQTIKIKGNEDNTITLQVTDLEIGISYNLEVDEMKNPEEVLLPANKLTGIVRDDWGETITFDIESSKAKLITQNGSFDLTGSDAEDFPEINTITDDNFIEINGDDIADAIDKTLFSTAKGDARYALNGIFLNIFEGNAEFVSSDTHRLSLSRKKIRNEKGVKQGSIVITKGMNELAKIARGQEVVKICLTTNELMAQTVSSTLVARLVDGQFPRYNDVIPSELPNKVIVEKDLLTKILRQVGQITNEETRSVNFHALENKLCVSASGNESGEGRNTMDIEMEGGEVNVSFNFTYIIDMLKVVSTDKLTMLFRDENSPMRMDMGDFTHIVMPIKPNR